MPKYDVYLAGSMTGRRIRDVLRERYGVRQWLDMRGITFYDPAEGEGLEKRDPDSIVSNAFDKRRMRTFVKKDLAAVAHSRCVLNITGDLGSEGSLWEMAFAVYYRQIPVYIVAPERKRGAKMTFTNILVDKIFNTQLEAIKHIQKELAKGDY